jgi:Secretion system C-terminal sorting domain
MKKITCLLFFALVSFAFGQSYNGPESVEFDYANNRWLIGNKNNGTVIARDMNGNFSAFVSGMTSGPYGIEILGNTLYCCYNGGSIRGFDLTSGAQVFNLNLGATFLNGICSDGVSNLFVTDFSAKKIYRVNVLNNSFNVFVTGLPKSPNGIIFEGANQRLVFVNWGASAPIQQVALSDSSVTTLVTTALSNIDGIAADAYGNYYVSTWGNNTIRRYSSNFTVGPTTVVTGLSSPADLFYNTVTDTLAIPNSGTLNNVVWVGFGSTLTTQNVDADNSGVKIFPSPSEERFTIDADFIIETVRIFDVSGRILMENNYYLRVKEQISIEAHLPDGIYLLELSGNGNRVTRQINICH